MASILIDDISALTVEAYLRDPRQNLGYLGMPGCGKTDEVWKAQSILAGMFGGNFGCDVVILSQRSPEDFTIPFPSAEDAAKGIYSHLTHSDWVYPPDAKGFLFLDEALAGSQDVLKSVQNIISSRMLNGHAIPPGIMIILASNRKEDRAGTTSFNTAFGNRVEWHEVEIHFKGWERWAIEHKISPKIIAFLKKFPQHLCDFKNDRLVNATPRTWAKANLVLDSKWKKERLCGLVGDGIAAEFLAFEMFFGEFPDTEDIRKNPTGARMPTSKDAQFALATALSMCVTKDLWPSFVTYVGRMDNEYKFMFMRESARLHPTIGLKNTKEWTDYIVTNQKDLI